MEAVRKEFGNICANYTITMMQVYHLMHTLQSIYFKKILIDEMDLKVLLECKLFFLIDRCNA